MKKQIPNYPDYSACEEGFIYSHRFGKIKKLKGSKHTQGYHQVSLTKNKKLKILYVHRLVLLTFKGYSKMECNHENGIKSDNRLSNLEYCTGAKNKQHAYDNGLNPRGEHKYNAKLTKIQVVEIKTILKNTNNYRGIHKHIGLKYNVSSGVIYHIAKGNSWKHITV